MTGKGVPALGRPPLGLINSVRSFATRNPSPTSTEYSSSQRSITAKHGAGKIDLDIKLVHKTEASLPTEVGHVMGVHALDIQEKNYEEGSWYEVSLMGEYQVPLPQEQSFYNSEDSEMEDRASSEQEEGSEAVALPGAGLVFFVGAHPPPGLSGLKDPEPRIISLLTDSEVSDVDDELIITNITPIRHKRSPPSVKSIKYPSSSSSSESESTDVNITHMTSPNTRKTLQVPKRRRRDSAFRTGPWSCTDRMLLVESMQRGVDFIDLGMKMQRDVDDVFEKFSDVIAAGLYKSQVKDNGTQTEEMKGRE